VIGVQNDTTRKIPLPLIARGTKAPEREFFREGKTQKSGDADEGGGGGKPTRPQ